MNAVVGIDPGNSTSVVAAACGRGVDILLNDESKRETPSLVAFPSSGKQRLIGSSASSSLSSISLIKHRILSSSPSASGEDVDVPVSSLGRPLSLSHVHVLAMLFSHLKSLAEKSLSGPVSDSAIAIPSYFTDVGRRFFLDAATISGLRPLRLLQDLTAAALEYGIYRTDLAAAHVVFVDIGHCGTQTAIVTFEPGQMRVLAHTSDPSIGGHQFDEILFQHFAQGFKREYGIDVGTNPKASARLMSACEKVKKVLSANAEAPLSIECLMDEIDVKGMVRRDEFEKMCSGLIERVVDTCRKAMEDSGVGGVERIHSVELVGSGSRVPAIGRALGGFFGKEPSRTLNSSECVARGCALQCAMLSPAFKVREYEVQDCLPFSIGLATDGVPVSTLSSTVLFPRGQPFPSMKAITFNRRRTFKLEAFYADSSELPAGTSQKIASFQIGPFEADGEKCKVKVKVRINLHGIFCVDSASLIEEGMNVNVTSHSDDVDSMDISSAPGTCTPDFVQDSADGGYEPADRSREGNSSRRRELPVSEIFHGGMSNAELLEIQELERLLAHQDKLMEQTKDKKNALEAYVYDIRTKLYERYRSFASDSEREHILACLQQTEDWLYEEGDDETVKVYSSRLEDLMKLVDPIEKRYKDEEARDQATRELQNFIREHRLSAKSLTALEKECVLTACNKAEQWLLERSQLQESLPKNVDPVFWSHQVKKVTEELETACKRMSRHKGQPDRQTSEFATDQ